MRIQECTSYFIHLDDEDREIIHKVLDYYKELKSDIYEIKEIYISSVEKVLNYADCGEEVHWSEIEALYEILDFYIKMNSLDEDDDKDLFRIYYEILAYYD